MFKLTMGQKDAIRKAIEWYFSPDKKPIFTLFGSAGTGKSSTANTVVSMLGLSPYQVLMVAPTGKAASVLRSKGNIANTIHSTFYHILQLPEMKKPCFVKKKSMPNTIKLILIDEFSMVNAKMCKDIESFGIPVLALGDPGQLPPMYSKNPYMDHPDVFLEEVMRQDGESGILQLATMARKGIDIDYGTYRESRVIHFSELKDIEKYDMVLTWSNSTRKEINQLIRKKLGLTSIYPIKGEKLMCLKNNYYHTIDLGDDLVLNPVNGLNLFSLSDSEMVGSSLQLDYAPDWVKDKAFSTRVSKIPFDAYKTMEDYEDTLMDNVEDDEVVLDFGYSCTCHKSQGSSWPNVLVLDEYRGAHSEYPNWLYTSLTRGEKSVTLCRMT